MRQNCKNASCNNYATNKGNGKWDLYCSPCKKKPYRSSLKSECELCGFVPIHTCQLDVDHIDGDHTDNSESNLQTLCANCHRLKTWLNRDWK